MHMIHIPLNSPPRPRCRQTAPNESCFNLHLTVNAIGFHPANATAWLLVRTIFYRQRADHSSIHCIVCPWAVNVLLRVDIAILMILRAFRIITHVCHARIFGHIVYFGIKVFIPEFLRGCDFVGVWNRIHIGMVFHPHVYISVVTRIRPAVSFHLMRTVWALVSYRTGTPVWTARSICVRHPWSNIISVHWLTPCTFFSIILCQRNVNGADEPRRGIF